MKKYIYISIILLFLCSKSNATMFGIGVAFGGSSTGDLVGPKIQIPIDFGDNFRIEPLIGQTSIGDVDSFEIGSGFYLKNSLGDQIDVFYGGSISLLDIAEESGIKLRPTLGLEYSFHPKFRMGVDIGYTIGEVGDLEVRGTDSYALVKIFF